MPFKKKQKRSFFAFIRRNKNGSKSSLPAREEKHKQPPSPPVRSPMLSPTSSSTHVPTRSPAHAQSMAPKKAPLSKHSSLQLHSFFTNKKKRIKNITTVFFVLCVLIISLLVGVYHQQIKNITRQQFTLQKIYIQGRTFTPLSEILLLSQLRRGTPIFDLSPQKITDQLSQIGWIKGVTVTRIFPNIIFIHIYERIPATLIKVGDTFQMTTQDGTVITSYHDINQIPQAFRDLPIIVSDTPNVDLNSFWKLYQNLPKTLASHLSYTSLIRNYRMDLHFDTNLTLRLPHDTPQETLTTLLQNIPQSLLLSGKWDTIDMRSPRQWLFHPAS